MRQERIQCRRNVSVAIASDVALRHFFCCGWEGWGCVCMSPVYKIATYSWDRAADRISVIAGRVSIALLLVGVIIAGGGLAGCSSDRAGGLGKGSLVSEKTIEQILEERTERWMSIPGVEGTAIGLLEDQPCILILSSMAPQQLRSRIPETIEGYNVVIRQTGTFQALEDQ